MKQQVPDRKRLRQEYLRKKATTYWNIALTGSLVVAAGFVCLWLVVAAGVIMHNSSFGTHDSAFFCFLFYAGIAVPVIVAGWIGLRNQVAVAKTIDYVPPVTPGSLPAEETLVRASEEPTVLQSEILLRAAHAEQETPQEELLRESQEE